MMSSVFWYQAGRRLGRIAPRRVTEWVARSIAWMAWHTRRRTRAVVVDNLSLIHPELTRQDCEERARRVFVNFARSVECFLTVPTAPTNTFDASCDVSLFREVVAELGERPVFILASAHIGPWELGGYALARLGYTVHTVALDHPSREVTEFYSTARRELGVRAHPLNGSFRMLQAALERGESVALLVDRAYGKAGKRFALFGAETEFPLGHLVLAMRCDVPVITGALVFDETGGFRYVHGGIHRPKTNGNERAWLDELQEACLRDLERIIRDHSDQWFHFKPIERTERYDA